MIHGKELPQDVITRSYNNGDNRGLMNGCKFLDYQPIDLRDPSSKCSPSTHKMEPRIYGIVDRLLGHCFSS
ncbi:hypothetical protein ACS0TY_025687 [Phlomoides rotata]